MGEWQDPINAIAVKEGDRGEVRLKEGGFIDVTFGYVEDNDGQSWLAFYDADGVEVLLHDIDAVRPAQRDMEGERRSQEQHL